MRVPQIWMGVGSKRLDRYIANLRVLKVGDWLITQSRDG